MPTNLQSLNIQKKIKQDLKKKNYRAHLNYNLLQRKKTAFIAFYK